MQKHKNRENSNFDIFVITTGIEPVIFLVQRNVLTF